MRNRFSRYLTNGVKETVEDNISDFTIMRVPNQIGTKSLRLVPDHVGLVQSLHNNKSSHHKIGNARFR